MPTSYSLSYASTPLRGIFRDDIKMWYVFYVCEGRAFAVPSISTAVEVGTRGLSVVVEGPCVQVCIRVLSVHKCGRGGHGSEVSLSAKVLLGCEAGCEFSAEDGAGSVEHEDHHIRRCGTQIVGVTAARP